MVSERRLALRHPFDRLSTRQLGWAFLVSSLLLAAVTQVFSATGRMLRTETAPDGILALELSGNASLTREIVQTWRSQDVLPIATFAVGFDFLYIVLYALALSLGCLWVIRRVPWRALATAGVSLAWLMWLAGLLDVTENIALFQMLDGKTNPFWAQLARVCALPKFLLVAAGILFIATAYLTTRVRDAFPGLLPRPS